MRPVSARFNTAVAASHRIATEVTVLRDGEAILELDTVVDGSVTLDITAQTRGRLDLTVADPTGSLTPTDPSDPLAPYGNELQVRRGIHYSNGDVELVGLGIYRIDTVNVTDTAAGLGLRIAGGDRSVRVIDARFEDPYQVTAATNYATAIQNVIAAGVPGLTYALTATTLTAPLLTANEGDDRWKFAQDMAASLGHVLYFDGDGICTSRPIAATGSTAPAAQLVEGEGGLLLDAERSWGRESTYNRVIATGENTGGGAPVRGTATDTTPTSPTYYYGPFGRVPRFYASPFLTTTAQANDAAAGILARELGTTQRVSFGTVTNPALEPNDVARITRARAGIDEDHVIDALTIGLGPASAMTGRSRAVTS